MQIKNYLSLFFFSQIQHTTYVPDGMERDSHDFHFFKLQKEFEKVADDTFEVFGRLFDNYQELYIHQTLTDRTISVILTQISVITDSPTNRRYRHLRPVLFLIGFVRLICNLAWGILLFVPAVLLKGCLWTFSFNFRQRNRVVLDLLKKQDDFIRQCDPKSQLFRYKQFSHPFPQSKNSLVSLPNDIQMYLLSFFNRKAIIPFALTCSKNYTTASAFNKTVKTDYSPFIRQSMAHERFSQLPIGVLPKNWKYVFDMSLSDQYQRKKMFFRTASTLLHQLTIWAGGSPNTNSYFSSLMQNQPIEKIEMLEGYALIIRIKDYSYHEIGLENIFVIAKKNERLDIFPYRLSPGLWLFLRDLSYHKEVPLVIDYLKRLFNGEPCGCFPENLNGDLEINYETQKASETLQEGPLFCQDRITPMVQLWPNPSAQNA